MDGLLMHTKDRSHWRNLGQNAPPLERIMRYVQFDPNGGCWLWDSGVTKNDHLEYPIFTLRVGKQQRVNRFMYEAHHGAIPAGQIVRHTCDVSLCVNPAHLILGSHIDNAADRESRGRSRWAGHTREYEPAARTFREACAHGHSLLDDNAKVRGDYRTCRACARGKAAAYRARKRAHG